MIMLPEIPGGPYQFHGSKVTRFDRYFDDDGYFVEYIETEDGGKWIAGKKPEEWSDEIRKLAKEYGVM